MTARSTRRAAEVAIINAAYRWRTAIDDSLSELASASTALERAVIAHEALGLDPTSEPAFSNNSTDTSAAAGASMRGLTGELSKRCYDEIEVAWRKEAVGLTVDQLEIMLNRSHQSVSARVNELRNKGWVVDSGQKRTTRSGRKAIVWTVSEQSKARR